MWPGHMVGDGWTWWLGGVVMLLFWGSLLTLAYFAIRAIIRSGRTDHENLSTSFRKGDALETLKERYARGEISREEYLEMRKDLEV